MSRISDETISYYLGTEMWHLPEECIVSICHELQAYRAVMPKLRATLVAFAESHSSQKQWCSFIDEETETESSISTKWFHGVVSADRAREALALLDSLESKQESE